MLNHYRPRETKWAFDGARRAFTITSLQPIGAGAQVRATTTTTHLGAPLTVASLAFCPSSS